MVVGGAATCMGQNVFSANVVGYVNVTVPASGFAMVANQLNTTNNTLANVIPNPPPNTAAYKYGASGYTVYQFDEFDLKWLPDGNATVNPGEGLFIKNPTTSPLTITFVGEVPQGTLTTDVPAGFAIRSSMVPQQGKLGADLGFPGAPNDQVYVYNNGSYTVYQFDEFDLKWLPDDPTIAVGQAFFSKKGAAASWTRTFTVPQ